jgi:hypothetical protein
MTCTLDFVTLYAAVGQGTFVMLLPMLILTLTLYVCSSVLELFLSIDVLYYVFLYCVLCGPQEE